MTVKAADDRPVVVRVGGELDIATGPQLVDEVARLVPAGADVSLDLGLVTFIDASGIRALMRLRNHLRRQRRQLQVTAVSVRVDEVFHLVEGDHLLGSRATPRHSAPS